jgi:hypothetical protein
MSDEAAAPQVDAPRAVASKVAARAAAKDAPRRPTLPNFVSFVLAVSLVWLGGQFVRQGVSDNLLDDNPELSMLWMGDSSDAIAQLARMRLQTRDPGGAARLAVKALQLEPLNAPALTTYGLAQETLRQTASANRAMTLAGRLGWRDLPTQLWLFRRDLLAFDFGDAFDHVDALLRRVPSPPVPVLTVLAAVSRDPRAVAPLASHLAASPSWRLPFFTFLAVVRPPATDVAGQLMTRLAAGPSPPTDQELGFYLAGLAGQGRYAEAEQAWRRLTPGGASQGSVHDGDFERPARPTPFDWWLTSGVGWTASIADSPEGHGKALRIDYDGDSKPLPLRQLIVLAPGAYRLSGRMLDAGGAGAPGFVWRVICPAGADPLAEAPAPQGAAGQWRAFSVDFTTPAAGCPAQLLDLAVERGDVPKDITVWYDDLAISPVTGVAPKTQAPPVNNSAPASRP